MNAYILRPSRLAVFAPQDEDHFGAGSSVEIRILRRGEPASKGVDFVPGAGE